MIRNKDICVACVLYCKRSKHMKNKINKKKKYDKKIKGKIINE